MLVHAPHLMNHRNPYVGGVRPNVPSILPPLSTINSWCSGDPESTIGASCENYSSQSSGSFSCATNTAFFSDTYAPAVIHLSSNHSSCLQFARLLVSSVVKAVCSWRRFHRMRTESVVLTSPRRMAVAFSNSILFALPKERIVNLHWFTIEKQFMDLQAYTYHTVRTNLLSVPPSTPRSARGMHISHMSRWCLI
ncbi:unnamed protein product, partial [Dicrocoelium dendriticum]